MYGVGLKMVELNKAFLEGISDLDCDENMGKFLKKILDYELILSDDKSYTQTDISEKYRALIENFSDGE